MKKFEVSLVVYDWIYWISIAVVVIWMILKAFGVIQSPPWQELLPYGGALVAILAYFQKMGRSLQKLDHLDHDFHEFKNKAESKFDEVKAELHKYDNRLIRIEAKLA